jgi:hypothetical protein
VKKKGPSPEKAKEILKDGTVRGHKLTPKAKRFMGWKAGGSKKPKHRHSLAETYDRMHGGA